MQFWPSLSKNYEFKLDTPAILNSLYENFKAFPHHMNIYRSSSSWNQTKNLSFMRARCAYCTSIKLFALNNAKDLTFPIFPLRMALLPVCRLSPPDLPCGAKLRALACYRWRRCEEGAHLNPYYTFPNDYFFSVSTKSHRTHCYIKLPFVKPGTN